MVSRECTSNYQKIFSQIMVNNKKYNQFVKNKMVNICEYQETTYKCIVEQVTVGGGGDL